MEQDHRAIVKIVQDPPLRGGGIGLFFVVPIGVGKAPENCLVPHVLGLAEHGLVEATLGGTVVGGDRHPDGGTGLLQPLQLGGECPRGGSAKVFMSEGVVAHQMPLGSHAADQLRVLFGEVPQNEEGPRGSLGLECVQHLGHVAVLIARVEGEVDHLVVGVGVGVGVVDIVAAVLLYLSQGRVGHGLGVVLSADAVPARPLGLGGDSQGREQEEGREQGGDELMEAGDGVGIVHGLSLLSIKNGVCIR